MSAAAVATDAAYAIASTSRGPGGAIPASTASAAGTPPLAQAFCHPRAPPFSCAIPRAAFVR